MNRDEVDARMHRANMAILRPHPAVPTRPLDTSELGPVRMLPTPDSELAKAVDAIMAAEGAVYRATKQTEVDSAAAALALRRARYQVMVLRAALKIAAKA